MTFKTKLDYLGIGNEDNGDETLFIDRVLKKNKEGEETALSLTDKVLEGRKENIEEVKEAEEAAKKAVGEGFDEGGDGGSDWGSDDDNDGDDGDGGDDDGFGDDGDFDLDDMGFDDPADSSEEEDNKDDKDDDKEDKKDDKDDKGNDEDKDVGNESLRSTTRKLKASWDIALGLREVNQRHLDRLASFGIGIEDANNVKLDEPTPIEDGTVNVVYAKDQIVEAVSKLSNINRKYVTHSQKYLEKMHEAVPKMDQRLNNYEVAIAGDKLELVGKLVDDVPLLKHVSYEGVSDPRKSLKRMQNYLVDTNEIASVLVKSDFNSMQDVFATKGFIVNSDELIYKKEIPGFNEVRATIPSYDSYLNSNITEFQFYSTSSENNGKLFDLAGVAVTELDEITFLVKSMKEIITELSVSIDMLDVITGEFKGFMNELNLLKVDIEEDAFEKLSEIGIDEKVQTFIKFKMVIEIVSVNTNLTFSYLTGLMSLFDSIVKFKEGE